MVIGVCGARKTNGMTLPPSPVDREIIAFWDDESAYHEFLDGTVMRRWRQAGDVFSLALHPISGHGDWGGSNALADASIDGSPEGTLVVLTYARVRFRDALTWYSRVSAPAGRAMAESPNLLGGTGGANWTGLTTFTMSVWPDRRAMLGAAYGKGNDHSQRVPWGKEHLNISIGHFVPGAMSGRWVGTSFSLGEPAAAEELA